MLKLYFQPGTDMAEATAQTVAYCNRALSVMPVGSLPPYVVRLDAGSLPVGYLVFESKTPLGRPAPGPGAVPGPADVLRPGGHLVAAAVRRQHPDDRRQRRPRPPPLLQPLAPGRRRRDRPRQLHQPLRQRDDQGPDDGRADQHDGRRPAGAAQRPAQAGGERLHPRRRHGGRRDRHPRRLRAGQRPQVGLPAGGQAGLRLDADGRQRGQGRTCPGSRRPCPTT